MGNLIQTIRTGPGWMKIAAALVIVAALCAVVAIGHAIGSYRYQQRVTALETQIRETQAKAQQAEGRAAENQRQAQAKETQITEANARAEASERALDAARNVTVTVRQKYDETRNAPAPVGPVRVADVCAKLAALNYPCE